MAFKKLMPTYLFWLLVGVLWLMPMSTYAQTAVDVEQTNSISQSIEESSAGTITVEIPDELLNLILNGAPRHNVGRPTSTQRPKTPATGKANGWRVQVFADGRNPSTLGARARARGNAIVARFPKYRGQVYTFSTAPNWYTRIGNFRTAAEANAALSELKRAFPAFASEMRTVQCTVILR